VSAAEEWREVVGFPDYDVSSLGRVRSWRCGSRRGPIRLAEPRLIRPTPDKDGYLRVDIRRGLGERRNASVHCLMLEAFVGPCPEGCETRHIDGVRANNVLANLAWGTDLENAADRVRHGTTGRGIRRGGRPSKSPRHGAQEAHLQSPPAAGPQRSPATPTPLGRANTRGGAVALDEAHS
jgi:hypothetical protein